MIPNDEAETWSLIRANYGHFVGEFKPKIKITMIDISCKFYLHKNVTYANCNNLIDAITKRKTLLLK